MINLVLRLKIYVFLAVSQFVLLNNDCVRDFRDPPRA